MLSQYWRGGGKETEERGLVVLTFRRAPACLRGGVDGGNQREGVEEGTEETICANNADFAMD